MTRSRDGVARRSTGRRLDRFVDDPRPGGSSPGELRDVVHRDVVADSVAATEDRRDAFLRANASGQDLIDPHVHERRWPEHHERQAAPLDGILDVPLDSERYRLEHPGPRHGTRHRSSGARGRCVRRRRGSGTPAGRCGSGWSAPRPMLLLAVAGMMSSTPIGTPRSSSGHRGGIDGGDLRRVGQRRELFGMADEGADPEARPEPSLPVMTLPS